MPQPKKAARPRIDAIVRHIKAGSFDEEIGQIQGAIDERNKARQDAVLKTVREVFGKKANIVIEKVDDESGEVVAAPAIAPRAKSKPAARRKRPGGAPAEAQELPPELAEAERAALERERQLEAEAAGQDTNPEDEEDGIISNSPIIGAVE